MHAQRRVGRGVVSIKARLRTILLCATLELGVLSGVPMRPEEIRALMHQLNQPKVAHVLPNAEQDGDPPGVTTA